MEYLTKEILFFFLLATLLEFSSSKTPLDMIYLETRTCDDQAEAWTRFATFVLQYKIPHIAVGILDLENTKNKKICDATPDSFLVNNFLKNLSGQGIRISIHPYDGFGDPRWPLKYKKKESLKAVMAYIFDLKNLLKGMHIDVEISGIVVGESMGGQPFKGDAATVQLFRTEAKNAGLVNIKIGAAAGDLVGMGLNELYRQIYDWTFYDATNPNFWEVYKNQPENFLKAIENDKVTAGWNDPSKKPPPAPWTEFKNYYNRNSGWKWEIQPPTQEQQLGEHFMVAMSVPKKDKGLQMRLEGWKKWSGVMSFFEQVKIKSKYKFALYMNEGLEPFKNSI